MQQSNPLLYYLEIVEHNEFKRLVHLSLKTGPATDDDIKQHMAETIINLKVYNSFSVNRLRMPFYIVVFKIL